MKKIISFLFIALICACNTSGDNLVGHQLTNEGDNLKILYSGPGDVVQFKMFGGFSILLKKGDSGIFEGQLEIPNIDNGIFSYEIVVHKQDSLRKMTPIEYKPTSGDDKQFMWIGKNRNSSFSKATVIDGKVTHEEINSTFLTDSRDVTIYSPKELNDETPIIYMTDGSNVASYAAYLDTLISEERIIPIKLVGVHSSQSNRHEEYVDIGIENELFKKHEDFFYKELITETEAQIKNWNGKRYVYGFSNGAAFCMHAGINHPLVFEEVIAFSTADYISEFRKPIEFIYSNYPKFYMGAGRYEEGIFNDNRNFVGKLKANKINVEFKEFVSGHDYNVWRIEFLEYLEKRFKK